MTLFRSIQNAFLEILNEDDRLVSFAITDENGIARVPLSTGTYNFQGSKIGHDTIINKFSVRDKPENVQVLMKPLTSIIFDIKEEIERASCRERVCQYV